MKDYDAAFTNTNGSPFPDTAAINSTTPTTKDGTEFKKDMVDDEWGASQALMSQAGMAPNGSSETAANSQRLEAVIRLAGIGVMFTDSGVANVYNVAVLGALQVPTVYYDGMEVAFYTANANTGASTIDVAGLGAKAIQKVGDTPIPANYIRTDRLNVLRYNAATAHFDLVDSGIQDNLATATETTEGVAELATQAETDAGTDDARIVTPLKLTKAPQSASAWVNFDGIGVVAIKDSYNVSSIIDNGIGQYSVNYTNNMATPNYAVSGLCNQTASGALFALFMNFDFNIPKTASSVSVGLTNSGATLTADSDDVSIIVHGALA